ncbi:MAG: hypothetical protein BroJett014_27750 [Planctomycetota bacterium]|nr:MAG: hypothetical protein BroJett014_27750 [Planctomycetota bacterium]
MTTTTIIILVLLALFMYVMLKRFARQDATAREAGHMLIEHADAMASIADCLWPEGDADHSWSADTLDEVARICREAGYGPNK